MIRRIASLLYLVAAMICSAPATAHALELQDVFNLRRLPRVPVTMVLVLDGKVMGEIESFDGGSAVGEVVVEAADSGSVQKKHIGSVKYENITLKVDAGMDPEFYRSVFSSFTPEGGQSRKSGSIILLDREGSEISSLDFGGAIVSEVSLPALDAAAKGPSFMTVKFSPEVTRHRSREGGRTVVDRINRKQKTWSPANFRLKIDGLDEACARVSKVDALTIKQKSLTDSSGDTSDYLRLPGRIEFPNLRITLPKQSANEFVAWHEDFVIRGNNGDDKEKSGSLTFLSANRQEELLTLEFRGLGIFRVSPDKSESNSDKIASETVEMYSESIDDKEP